MLHSRSVKIIAPVLVVAAIIALVVVLVLTHHREDDYYGHLEKNTFRLAAVAANGLECAAIGRDILLRNGTVADAAIATLFCDGIACTQCMGLGGGFLLTIYKKDKGTIEVLNAREVAPLLSTPDMFEGGNISTTIGGLAVAVPGELKGYEELHRKYGKLPWADLIKPTIELCRSGVTVTPYLATALRDRQDRILNEPTLSEIFINPATGNTWESGDKIKRLKLAETLEIVAKEKSSALYNGTLTKGFLEDINNRGGIITTQDLLAYKPKWQTPVSIDLGNDLTLYSPPLPGSGHVLSLIVNTLKNWAIGEDSDVEPFSNTYWQRIIETFKYAYAKKTGLGDLDFLPHEKLDPLLKNMTNPEYAEYLRTLISDTKTYNDYRHYGAQHDILEDHGTAQISVVAPNGDAISVTSTINFVLGAFFRSQSTGIILNNEMDDFSYPNMSNADEIPPSPTNFPEAKKHPLSSMVPSIIVEKDLGVRLVIGGAGGTKITTQVALAMMKHIYNDMPLKEAIDQPRIHHQLLPMEIQQEEDFDPRVITALKSYGHNVTISPPGGGFAAVIGIAVNKTTGVLIPTYDKRRQGSVAGI